MAGDRENRIREKAHQIWEKEGRPHGHDKRHWNEAERELNTDASPAVPGGAPKARGRAKATPAAPAAKTSAPTKTGAAAKPKAPSRARKS